ncbi:MAG: DUF11 domain-containing protein [Anaerolineae bacterium]|nr:DUF11 domain-containing protein [Anaerolineae bacterium]
MSPKQRSILRSTLALILGIGTLCLWRATTVRADPLGPNALPMPYLVKDIAVTTGGADPQEFVDVNGIVFFIADDGYTGVELWRSDGTPGGTRQVKDIWPGASSSNPEQLTNVNGTLFFIADDGVNGEELWVSDGSRSGTKMVKDIGPGATDGQVDKLAVFSNTLFFEANDTVYGRELWRSDGTESGTVIVKDINPGSNHSLPDYFAVTGDRLFFRALDDTNGFELWASDGTEGGTVMVKDINPTGSSGPRHLTNVEGTLFFLATHPDTGQELWKSDGTVTGTILVKDIYSGTSSSGPYQFVGAGGQVFFLANDGSGAGQELWTSDGTPTGTLMLKDIYSGATNVTINSYGVLSDVLYFDANDGIHGAELWRSDGTPTGTLMVSDFYSGSYGFAPGSFAAMGSRLYFSANTLEYGRELWATDGTVTGTVLIKDIEPNGTSNPSYLTLVGGDTLYFSAYTTMYGRELWHSDGTVTGTTLVEDLNTRTNDASISEITYANGKIFFSCNDQVHGYELCTSDGTEAGTLMLRDIYSGEFGSNPNSLVAFNDKLYFGAQDKTYGIEMWTSDGTPTGTVMLVDMFSGTAGLNPDSLTPVGDMLFFKGYSPTLGSELWMSDGTPTGTLMVKDVFTGAVSSNIESLTAVEDVLFFVANIYDGPGKELWISDGTEAGTHMVKDIHPSGNANPQQLTDFGGTLFFSAYDDTYGGELWRSNGSEAGTLMVKDIYTGSGGASIENPFVFNDLLFFSATDGVHGKELWRSDGTEAGTLMVKDIYSGAEASRPGSFVSMDGWLYFEATTAGEGRELWRTDGTPENTQLVIDIYPGPNESSISDLVNANGLLFFNARDDAGLGMELWQSDGTPASTQMVADIWPGPEWSHPWSLLWADKHLFFIAQDLDHGSELWALDIAPNLVVTKTQQPGDLFTPGDAITYTLRLANTGRTTARGVVLSDVVPAAINAITLVSSSLTITDTGANPGFVWDVEPLEPGAGGVLTLTGILDEALGMTVLTNTATLTSASPESNPADNTGAVIARVSPLIISEMMMDPASGEPDWEWIEVYNKGVAAVNLAGYVLDDDDGVALGSANIAGGIVPAGGTAVLYNADALTQADFEAAWSPNSNAVAVTNWPALANSDRVALWKSYNDYYEGYFDQVIDEVFYLGNGAWPTPNNAASIYLTDLQADNAQGGAWALSAVGGATPAYVGYQSLAAGGNSGGDVGSPAPLVDLAIHKSVSSATLLPGDPLTYTLTFTNTGLGIATAVVITDALPLLVNTPTFVYHGVAVTATGGVSYTWQVADMPPGAGGAITVSGVLGTGLPAGDTFTNTATIACAWELNTGNNHSRAAAQVENALPVARDESYITLINTPLHVAAPGVLGNDSDRNGDTLSAVLDDGPAEGELDLEADGSFAYTPTLDFAGSVTFTYQAGDGLALSNVAQVTLAVTAGDVTPPQIISTAPQNGAQDVALDAPVILTFDEPVITSTLAYTFNPDPGGWVSSWNAAATQITLAHAGFGPGITYTGTVLAAEDIAGNALAAAHTWSFTTQSGFHLYLPLVLKE